MFRSVLISLIFCLAPNHAAIAGIGVQIVDKDGKGTAAKVLKASELANNWIEPDTRPLVGFALGTDQKLFEARPPCIDSPGQMDEGLPLSRLVYRCASLNVLGTPSSASFIFMGKKLAMVFVHPLQPDEKFLTQILKLYNSGQVFDPTHSPIMLGKGGALIVSRLDGDGRAGIHVMMETVNAHQLIATAEKAASDARFKKTREELASEQKKRRQARMDLAEEFAKTPHVAPKLADIAPIAFGADSATFVKSPFCRANYLPMSGFKNPVSIYVCENYNFKNIPSQLSLIFVKDRLAAITLKPNQASEAFQRIFDSQFRHSTGGGTGENDNFSEVSTGDGESEINFRDTTWKMDRYREQQLIWLNGGIRKFHRELAGL